MTETVGQRIRRLRERVGLTQRGLVDSTSFSAAYLCRVEKDTRRPSEQFLRAIAEPLDSTAHFLEQGGHGRCPHCEP
jgi:transcriptional regulator with XRE-family HTH domain